MPECVACLFERESKLGASVRLIQSMALDSGPVCRGHRDRWLEWVQDDPEGFFVGDPATQTQPLTEEATVTWPTWDAGDPAEGATPDAHIDADHY